MSTAPPALREIEGADVQRGLVALTADERTGDSASTVTVPVGDSVVLRMQEAVLAASHRREERARRC